MDTQSVWKNSCRLCSEEKKEMLPIFGEEGLRRRIPQKLRVCLPIMVYKTDPLPKQICQFCAARLDDAFEFKEYCIKVYKNMHLKLLSNKNSNTVKIFLDAMINSSDPCQVQLCVVKQRAPPPLVPLPSSLPINSSTPIFNAIAKKRRITTDFELRPELACEVQIKKELPEISSKADLNLNGNDINQSANDENAKKSAKLTLVGNKPTDSEKKTSILEQVLTGNLTINNCQELVPKKKLSSEWWCSPCNNYYRTKESLVKHMQFYCPRKYACGKCSLVFESVEELAKHEAKDHLKITLNFCESAKECHQCDRKFISWETLRHHRLRDHYVGSAKLTTNTWCPPCNRFFPNEQMYYDHQKLHQVDLLNDTVDHKMNENVTDVKEKKHEHNLENIKSLSCSTCGKVCTQQSALSNHMRIHEPKKYKCEVCGRSFGIFIRLAAHKLTEHNIQSTISPIMTSVEQEEVLNAEREAREAREGQSNKNDCCRTFSETFEDDNIVSNEQSPVKRATSINDSSSKNIVRCGICEKLFNDHTTMLNHLKSHLVNVYPKNFNCSICSKSFKEKLQLRRHEESHKRLKATNYECAVCNKSFSDKAQMDSHEKIHIVDKTYHCPKCNKIFFKESSLITHQCTSMSFSIEKKSTEVKITNMKSSSNIKRFKCLKCPEFFDTTQLRNLHMRIHTEPKLPSRVMNTGDENDSMPKIVPETIPGTLVPILEPKVEIIENQNLLVPQKRTLIKTTCGYRCGVCQSPFILRELAVAHLRSAHPVMPYQCPYCKKRFITQYTFTHHIKTDHLDESEK